MGINETIIKQMANFEANTGIEPDAIYLGFKEMALFEKWTYATFNMTFKISDDHEFMGTKVYEVRMENHLGIGYQNRKGD